MYLDGADSGYIFQGQMLVLDGGFSTVGSPAPNAYFFHSDPSSPTQGFAWEARFYAPTGAALAVGVYRDAGLGLPATQPQFHVLGSARSCNTTRGEFEIQRLVSFTDAGVAEFAATFDQLCEGDAGDRLQGCVHFTSLDGG